MTSLLLFIVTLVPPLILYGLYKRTSKAGLRLGALALGATLIHEILLIALPTFYSISEGYQLENDMIATVNAEDLLRVMIGESVFMALFALGLIVKLPSIGLRTSLFISPVIPARVERNFTITMILIGCLLYVSILIFPGGTDEKSSGGGLGQLHFWLKAVFWYTPLITCAFVVTKKNSFRDDLVLACLALLPIVSLFLIGISTGVRGRIIWGISLLILGGVYNGRHKLIGVSVALAVLMVPIFSILGSADIRDSSMSGTSQVEVVGKLYELGKENVADVGALTDVFMYSYAWRAQGVRNSVTLYQDYEHGGGGFNSYLSAIFVPVPRFLWDKKPMIGSQDHTEIGSAMYKVMDMAYGAPDQMGPMLASAHSYWEGGIIWLLCAGFITGVMWNIIFRITSRLPFVMATIFIFTFAAAQMVDGLLTMMIPLFTAINVCWMSLLPVFLIYKFFKGLREFAMASARVN